MFGRYFSSHYFGRHYFGRRSAGQSASIVGAGGVQVGGAATIEANHLVRPSEDLFRAPQRREKPKPQPLPVVLQSVSVVGAGGLRVWGSADIQTVRAQLMTYQARGGVGWRGDALVDTATPIRTRNALILQLEALDAFLDDAA